MQCSTSTRSETRCLLRHRNHRDSAGISDKRIVKFDERGRKSWNIGIPEHQMDLEPSTAYSDVSVPSIHHDKLPEPPHGDSLRIPHNAMNNDRFPAAFRVPQEVWRLVFVLLSLEDLCSVAWTCREWHAVVSDLISHNSVIITRPSTVWYDEEADGLNNGGISTTQTNKRLIRDLLYIGVTEKSVLGAQTADTPAIVFRSRNSEIPFSGVFSPQTQSNYGNTSGDDGVIHLQSMLALLLFYGSIECLITALLTAKEQKLFSGVPSLYWRGQLGEDFIRLAVSAAESGNPGAPLRKLQFDLYSSDSLFDETRIAFYNNAPERLMNEANITRMIQQKDAQQQLIGLELPADWHLKFLQNESLEELTLMGSQDYLLRRATNMPSTREMSLQFIFKLLQQCPRLRQLAVGYFRMCNETSEVQESTQGTTEQDWDFLSRFLNLQSLHLEAVGDLDLYKLFQGLENSSVTILKLRNEIHSSVTWDESIKKYHASLIQSGKLETIRSSSRLTHLTIFNSPISSQGVRRLFELFANLSRVVIDNCPNITDWGSNETKEDYIECKEGTAGSLVLLAKNCPSLASVTVRFKQSVPLQSLAKYIGNDLLRRYQEGYNRPAVLAELSDERFRYITRDVRVLEFEVRRKAPSEAEESSWQLEVKSDRNVF